MYFLVKDACFFVIFDLVLSCFVIVDFPYCRRYRNNLNDPLSRSLFLFGWLLNKKAARIEVNISLAFLHWVGIALHLWPFISDIAIFVLKGDVKLQLTPVYFHRPSDAAEHFKYQCHVKGQDKVRYLWNAANISWNDTECSYILTEAISNIAVAVQQMYTCRYMEQSGFDKKSVCVIGSVLRYHWRGTNVRSSLISSSRKRCQNMTATRPAPSPQKYVSPMQTSRSGFHILRDISVAENIVLFTGYSLHKLLGMAAEISFDCLFQLENLLRRISLLIPESGDAGELLWLLLLLEHRD